MKRISFLFFMATFCSFIAMAQTATTLSELFRNATIIYEDEFEISYNSYGMDSDGDGYSDQWQDGFDVLEDAVYDATRRPWKPKIGEIFMFSIKGTSNFTGEMSFYIVDQRPDAGYWSEMCHGSVLYKVEAGKSFEYTFTLVINNTNICTNTNEFAGTTAGEIVDGGLLGEFVIACFPETTSSMADFDDYPCIFYDAELKILYQKAVTYEDPLPLSFDNVVDGAFGYVGDTEYNSTSRVKSGDYVNVVLSAVAEDDIDTLLYEFVDAAKDATPVNYNSSVTDLVRITTGIKKGDIIDLSFSIPVSYFSESEIPDYKNRFRAYDASVAVSLYLSNVSVTTTVGSKKYEDITESFTISGIANPELYGSVIGGGDYESGETISLVAVPNTGYEFTSWSDGNTENPRTITVTKNETFIANFKASQSTTYTITLAANNSAWGTIVGGGEYEKGKTAILVAVASSGYEFESWNDGNTDNPRSITVTKNEVFIANFKASQSTTYTVTLSSNNSAWGTIVGGGEYEKGKTAILVAVASSGYEFESWNDGNIDNPRTITVIKNEALIANFKVSQSSTVTKYTVIASANDNTYGSVVGGGEYMEGSAAILVAVPTSGFLFDKWSDGSTDNPRTITITKNENFVANFKAEATQTQYTVTLSSNNNSYGTTMGDGEYAKGTNVTLIAIPETRYKFVSWSDGNTENPRSIVVSSNISLMATFAKAPNDDLDYTVTAISANNEQGAVAGSGIYSPLATALLAAVAYKGYQFVQWNDGNTDNPREITVIGNSFYVATFEKISTDIFDVEEDAMTTTIVNRQILVNGEAPAFVVTVSGQKIKNANLKAGVYFVVVDGNSVGVVVR